MYGATAVVGNDSGLCHLAAACGAPVVVLFGPTDPSHCAPWGPRVHVLRKDGVPCAPCFKRHCYTSGHPCLVGIGPDQVWTELRSLISV